MQIPMCPATGLPPTEQNVQTGSQKRQHLALTQAITNTRDHVQVMSAGATNLAQVNAFKYLG